MRIAHFYVITSLLLSVLSLSACGGGGGDADAGTGAGSNTSIAPSPGYTLGRTTFTINAAVNESIGDQRLQVPVSFVSVPNSATIYGRIRFTSDIFTGAYFEYNYASRSLDLVISVKHPHTLAPNTYSEQADIRLCLDANCNTPLASNQQSITLVYNVTRPTGALNPRLSVSATSLSVDSIDIASETSLFELGITLHNMPFQGALTITPSSGIRSAGFAGEFSFTNMRNLYRLPPPRERGIGTYHETIHIRACIDSSCVNELEGSPVTINVTQRVLNELSLVGGHVMRTVPMYHTELLWDAHSRKFYFLIPADNPADDDMVGSYDPATRMHSTPVPVGQYTQGLAISDDGQFLYAGSRTDGAVYRFNLPGLTPSLTIPMGASANGMSRLYPRVISVVPGAPRTIVVGTSALNGQNDAAVAVFDNAVRRSTLLERSSTTYEPFVDAMCFGPSNGRLFGARSTVFAGPGTSDTAIYEMTLTAAGVQLNETTPNIGYMSHDIGRRLHCTPSRVYSDDSRVFDPTTNVVVNPFPNRIEAPSNITLNQPYGKIFGGGALDSTQIRHALRSYDLHSFLETNVLPLPDGVNSTFQRIGSFGTEGVFFAGHAEFQNSRAWGSHLVMVEGAMFGQ